ncbi:hypothetical protein [Citreicella sp. C3M06]|uniref:hypothetical protein n=1 Tax=Citreicella sp. C3M06 TaxID=2841564 RepID=UPI002090E0E3|nr:hypothetical protein [Citreicella sp. C3M06]
MFQPVRSLRQRVASLRAALTSRNAPVPDGAPTLDLRPYVDLPQRTPSPDAAERERIRAQGRYLARQDDWETLSRGLREADEDRARTLGGTPMALLLAEGAHVDALSSACGAIARDDPTAVRGILYTLRDCIERSEEDPWLGYTLALAHVAVADAWNAAPTPGPLHRDARAQHLETAHHLITRFDPIECNSAAIAALRCTLLDVAEQPCRRVFDDYEDLIDLDPGCEHHLRALGRDLRPSRFGSWDKLDREARRTAARVADLWGMGGYSWVWFDVLAVGETRGFAYVDPELFVEGLHDILARRPDQHMANRLAAYCGVTLAGAASARSPRQRIATCLDWIAQDHLHEIHPDIWARALPVPRAADTAAPLRSGQARTLETLGKLVADPGRDRTVRVSEAAVHDTPAP